MSNVNNEAVAKRVMEILNNEAPMTSRRFGENDNKNIIHGSNINGYVNDIPKDFCAELEERVKKIKDKILSYTTDDAGNIDCFIETLGKHVVYNCDEQCYQIWTGRAWLKDTENRVQLWCQTIMKARRDYTFKALKGNPSVKNYKDLMRHAKGCCNQRSIRAIIEGLKSALACNSSKFDKHPYLLNVLNGTIDLRTGKIRTHSHKDYITMLVPVIYDPEATSSKFKGFLKETFQDEKTIKYIQKLLGYCVTGETKEQSVYFWIGNGANGKSTLLSLMRYIINEYAAVIPSKVLTSIERSGATSSEIAQLPHKRLVCCSELNCTDVLNEGKIKIMSSGETLSARQLYTPSFAFEPEFKFIIDTNYLPIITGTDHGIWRRIKVIPFEYTVPKSKLNKNLLNELKRERKAVLAWLVAGAVKYYSDGLGTCEAVEKATKKYRKSQDTLGSFIESCIKEEKGSEVRARALYEAYLAYCSDNFLTPMSETKFGKDFTAYGYKRGKDKISRKYIDIRLKQ